jgi:hypothetical protein
LKKGHKQKKRIHDLMMDHYVMQRELINKSCLPDMNEVREKGELRKKRENRRDEKRKRKQRE